MSSIFQVAMHALGGGPVKFNIGVGPPLAPTKSQHLLLDSSDAVYAVIAGTPVSWQGGVPFDANGRVMITESDVVASVGVGATPYDANGRLAVGGSATHYNHGVAYSATGALAGAAPDTIPATDQTVLTVGVNEIQYGFFGDEPVGAVNPGVVFGQIILYLYSSPSTSTVVLKFVGGAQISGTAAISMTFSGGGLPPGPFTIAWNALSSQYDTVQAAAAGYLQSQNGNDVTVDMTRL